MWPFKRKPKAIDRRDNVNWHPGEKAICVIGDWDFPAACHPEVGDVLTVVTVFEATVRGILAVHLGFKAIPGNTYESGAFRKLVDIDSAAMIQRIKTAGKSKARTNA